jgi:hypothetical protein
MHGNKKTLFLVMVYSALFNNVCKALNLKQICSMAMASVCPPYLEVLHRVLTWLGIGD